jgi:hypothetical protein
MMARSSNAPSMGRIQKRKTNLSKSSLSACNAPPVHTDGPGPTILHCKNLERHADSLARSRCAIAPGKRAPHPGRQSPWRPLLISGFGRLDGHRERPVQIPRPSQRPDNGSKAAGGVIGLSKFASSDRFGLVLASIWTMSGNCRGRREQTRYGSLTTLAL